ncbi:MAG: glycosyltransferase family A protein [bacterium]|nr:glycosyltransferase family A protein [bacterium]
MQKNTLISVIIPVYNQAEEIQQSLHSLLTQSHKNYEVIVVNDGSTDSTAKVLDEMKKIFWQRGIRFKSIQQSNRGSNHARNRGREESRGEFIIFWDSDIVAASELLEKLLNALRENPEASYAYSSFIFGKKKFKLWEFNPEKLKQLPYIHSSSLIRKDHFPPNGWDARVKRLQDWDVWLTMLENGYKGVWVPEFLFTVLTKHGTMSVWLPKYVYKVPWLSEVKKYKKAVEVIKKKHKL